jgi:hypothetical protein
MTAMNPTATRPSTLNPKKIILFLASAIAGAVAGAGLISFIKAMGVSVKALTPFDIASLTIAALFIAMGLVQSFITTNRMRLAKMLESGDAASLDDIGERIPATDREVHAIRLQSAVLVLAGVMLILPIAVLGAVQLHPAIAGWVFAGILLLFLAQTVLNIRIWQTCDEFVRSAILKTCAMTFAIVQSLLFLWAAAERLHLAPAISSWNSFTVLMSCYIGVSTWLSIRMKR